VEPVIVDDLLIVSISKRRTSHCIIRNMKFTSGLLFDRYYKKFIKKNIGTTKKLCKVVNGFILGKNSFMFI
jgi:hypothetical protein